MVGGDLLIRICDKASGSLAVLFRRRECLKIEFQCLEISHENRKFNDTIPQCMSGAFFVSVKKFKLESHFRMSSKSAITRLRGNQNEQ